jgi:hypothetical protein
VTTLLDQVPAAIGRVQREIVLARFLGKLAVDQGVREVRQRLESLLVPAETPEEEQVAPSNDAAMAVEPIAESVIDPTTLALADYDHLPASDIVSMLAGLDPTERDAIEAYELQGRHRRTILGKLAQLREA